MVYMEQGDKDDYHDIGVSSSPQEENDDSEAVIGGGGPDAGKENP